MNKTRFKAIEPNNTADTVNDITARFLKAFKAQIERPSRTTELARSMVRGFLEREKATEAAKQGNGLRKFYFSNTRTKASDAPSIINSSEKPGQYGPTTADARTLEMWRRWVPALYDDKFLSVLKVVMGEFDVDTFIEDCARAFIELDTEGSLGLTRDRTEKVILDLINDAPLLQLRKREKERGGNGGAPANTGVRPLDSRRHQGAHVNHSRLI